MNDPRFEAMLRQALPPTADEAPARDVWLEVVARIDRGPRWSPIDLALAAAVVVMLLLFPEWFWLLAYHL